MNIAEFLKNAVITPKNTDFNRNLYLDRSADMRQEHEIVSLVYEARENSEAADRLVGRYLPFIKSETAKFIHRSPEEGKDDELSIAMFAFHEAVLSYQRLKGAFLPYAALAIRNRLIDYSRREKRHSNLISIDAGGDDDEKPLTEQIQMSRDDISEYSGRSIVREEIMEFSCILSEYGLTLTNIAENCPRQARTLAACHKALACAREHTELLGSLTATKKLPLSQLALLSGVEKKTLERHRKYMVAILLAYTNGFEIIRGHLGQMSFVKGGRQI